MFKALSPDGDSAVTVVEESTAEVVVPASELPGEDGPAVAAAEVEVEVPLDDDLPAQEEPTAEAEEAVGDEPQLDAATVDLAKRMGVSDDDLSGFADTKDLQRYLTLLDRTTLSRLKQQEAAQADPAKQPAGDEAQPTAKADGASQFEKLKLDLDPELWDENAAAVLNKINDHYAGVIEQLTQKIAAHEQVIGGVQQQEQARAQEQFERTLDGWFEKLGDDYADTFGAGSIKKLDPSSPLVKNRQDLVAEAEALAVADQKLGRQPSTPEQLLQRALGARYHDKTKTIAQRAISREVAKRRATGVARPASRSKTLTADERAALNAEQFFKDKGYDSDELGQLDEV